MVKNIAFAGLIFMLVPLAAEAHTILGDAATLTRGTLPNERLDPSSVTLLTSNPSFGAFQGDGLRSTHTKSGIVGGLLQNTPGAITSTMTVGLGRPLNFYDKGQNPTPTGQIVTTINCANGIDCNQIDGTTVTISVRAKIYKLVVGTGGAVGVDVALAGGAAGQAAFDTLPSSYGAANRDVWTSSISAVIGFSNGVYEFTQATVPAGVTWEGLGSSVVFVFKGIASQQMLRVYGTMKGIKIDASGVAFRSPLIQLSSNSVFGTTEKPMEVSNIGNIVGGVLNSAAIFSSGTTNVKIVANIRDAVATGGVNYVGDSAPVLISNCSDFVLVFPLWQEGSDATTTGAHLGIIQSTNGWVQNSYFKDWGAEGIGIQESHSIHVIDNDFVISQAEGSHGIIAVAINSPYGKGCTDIEIARNRFRRTAVFAGSMIKIGNGSLVYQARVGENTSWNNATGATFITIGNAASIATHVLSNTVRGGSAFSSDSGTASLLAGNDNLFNGTEQ